MNENEAAALFRTLSNSDRLRVIKTLVEAGSDGLTAGEICEKIDASPSRASFHLAALSESQFINCERQSRSLRYRIDFKRIGELMAFLMQDCCAGSTQLRRCCGLN